MLYKEQQNPQCEEVAADRWVDETQEIIVSFNDDHSLKLPTFINVTMTTEVL